MLKPFLLNQEQNSNACHHYSKLFWIVWSGELEKIKYHVTFITQIPQEAQVKN